MTDELSTFLNLLKEVIGDKPNRPEDDVKHYHVCRCGNVWGHTRNHAMKHGYDETHTCGKCGQQQFMATFRDPPSHIKIGKSKGVNFKLPRRKPSGPKSDFLKQLENL